MRDFFEKFGKKSWISYFQLTDFIKTGKNSLNFVYLEESPIAIALTGKSCDSVTSVDEIGRYDYGLIFRKGFKFLEQFKFHVSFLYFLHLNRL